MSAARCGTRAAIIAHLEYGEPLDGPCAAADTALRLEAERCRPYAPHNPVLDDSADSCARRRHILTAETIAWENANRAPKLRAVS
jgi:hypothetical protein